MRTIAGLLAVGVMAAAPSAEAMTLREAVEAAVHNHPAVAAAQANRRATAYELLQSQGRKLPRVDLDADIGAERIDRPFGLAPAINDQWRTRRQGTIALSQPLFDGWDRINDIYRNAARVDAAAYRVLARSEVLALEAIEAYINIRRIQKSIEIADSNIAAHRRIRGRVMEQVALGKVPESEAVQVDERLAGAEAQAARIKQSLAEAEVSFLRVVGKRPAKLHAVSYPAGVPMAREAAVSSGLGGSPLIAASQADSDVARHAWEQSKSARYPSVGLEVRGTAGHDLGGTPGPNREVSARIVLKWNLFDGMISRNRQMEFAERWSQAQAEEDERKRSVQAEIERALVAYHGAKPRIDALKRQLSAAQKVVGNYETEYGIGKRTLLDLLNAESSRFVVAAEVANTEAVAVFSAYRVLGAMGHLVDAVKVGAPDEAGTGARDTVKALGWRGNMIEPLKR